MSAKRTTSTAPALERGLTILEMFAARDAVGFNEIAAALGIPKASTVRLLRVLCGRGYVAKDASSGKYVPGPKMAVLGQGTPLVDRLRREGADILTSLRDRTQNTALLLYWTGRQTQSLAKEIHPAAIAMQEVGSIDERLARTPWGWFFYDTLDAEHRRVVHKPRTGPLSAARFKKHMSFYRRHGFTYDDQEVFRHVRRLAAPIRDFDGGIVGAIGLGGNSLTIPDDQVQTLGGVLVEHTDELSRRIGWSGESAI